MMKNKFRVLLFCLFAVTADTKAADYSDGKQDNLRNIYSLLEYTPAQWSVLRDFPDAHLLSLMTNFKLKECSPTRLLILKDIVFNKTDKPFCLVPHMKIPSQFTVAHLCSEALTKEVKSISEIIKNINALTLGQLLVISQFPHLHRPEIISDTIEFGYSEATLRSLLVCPLLLRPFVPFFSSDQVKAMTFLPTDVKLYHTLVGLNSRYSPRKIAVLANVIESINRYVEPMEAVQKLDNLCKAIDPLYKIRFIPEKLALLSDEEAVLFERISVDVQLQILREWQIGILFTDEVKALVQLPISGISFFFLAPNRCTQEQLTVLKELPDDCFPLILASKVDITRYSFPKLKMITTMLQDNSDIPNCDIMSVYEETVTTDDCLKNIIDLLPRHEREEVFEAISAMQNIDYMSYHYLTKLLQGNGMWNYAKVETLKTLEEETGELILDLPPQHRLLLASKAHHFSFEALLTLKSLLHMMPDTEFHIFITLDNCQELSLEKIDLATKFHPVQRSAVVTYAHRFTPAQLFKAHQYVERIGESHFGEVFKKLAFVSFISPSQLDLTLEGLLGRYELIDRFIVTPYFKNDEGYRRLDELLNSTNSIRTSQFILTYWKELGLTGRHPLVRKALLHKKSMSLLQ